MISNGASGNWIGLAPVSQKLIDEDFRGIYAKDAGNEIWGNGEDGVRIGAGSEGNAVRGNRFGFNGRLPIQLRYEGEPIHPAHTAIISSEPVPNRGVGEPRLEIRRQGNEVAHLMAIDFKGAPQQEVTLDLYHFQAELFQGWANFPGRPIESETFQSKTLKTDKNGRAVWKIVVKNYPAGSWSATATVEGSTGEMGNLVVLPWLH